MRTAVEYILKEFLRYYLLLMGVFVFVYLLVDVLDRIDNFVEYQSTGREIVAYFAYKMPFILLQMSAVAVLLSVVITLSTMNRNNEIVALKAGGVSIHRMSVPIILVSLFISLLSFVVSDRVVPYTNARVSQLWHYEMRHNQPVNRAQFKRFKGWYRSDRAIYNVQRLDLEKQMIEGVDLYFFDEGFDLSRRVEADRGFYKDGRWTFFHGTDKTIGPNGFFNVDHFDEKEILLSERPEDFRYVEKSADQMSLDELNAAISQLRREGYETTYYQVDRQVKFSLPFVCVVMTILAIPVALRQGRNASMAQSAGVGIGMAFIYLAVFGIGRSLGHSGALPILLAAWLPNLVFALSGAYLMVTLRQ